MRTKYMNSGRKMAELRYQNNKIFIYQSEDGRIQLDVKQ